MVRSLNQLNPVVWFSTVGLTTMLLIQPAVAESRSAIPLEEFKQSAITVKEWLAQQKQADQPIQITAVRVDPTADGDRGDRHITFFRYRCL